MPNFAAKYSSEVLTAERMRTALAQLPSILIRLFGQCAIKVCYGFGTNLHGDLLYIPMGVSTEVLPYFLEESIDQRITVPGHSDLLLTSPNNELDLLFCHESDIHVNGDNEEMMRRFIQSREFEDVRFYSQSELEAKYPDRNR